MAIIRKHILIFVSLILSLLATLAIPFVSKDNLAAHSFSNSIFSVFVGVAFFFLLKKAFFSCEKRCLAFALPLGLLFSFFMVCGENVLTTNGAYIFALVTWCKILAITPVFTAAISLLFRFLSEKKDLCAPEEENKKKTKKRFFIVWLLIFLAWIPPLLASYPGVYGYDCIGQINYYRDGYMSLHHPIAHTYLLGFFVITVGEMLGSYEGGMFCYSLFQMLCLSAAFSAIDGFVARRCAKWLRIIILLFMMFFPTNHMMAFAGTKDIFFAMFFALCLLHFLQAAENPKLWRKPWFCIRLILFSFLMIVFRNQGIYIFAAVILFSLLFFRKQLKSLLFVLISVFLLTGIYNGPVTKALGGIEANSLREMMSVPCMQLSRVALENSDQITEEELTLIKEYIPDYHIYEVNSGISDAMKGTLDTERIKENPMEFFKLWIKVGLKCPIAYVDAFARLTVGYWYPDMNYRDPEAYHPYWEYYPTGKLEYYDPMAFLLLEQTPVKGLEWLHDLYYRLTYDNFYQSVPIFSMLFSSGLPFWCLLFYFVYCLYQRAWKHLIPALFMLLLVATLLLGPVVLYRYVYPLCISIPLILASAVNIKKQVIHKKGEEKNG